MVGEAVLHKRNLPLVACSMTTAIGPMTGADFLDVVKAAKAVAEKMQEIYRIDFGIHFDHETLEVLIHRT
jgi:hypothetical protein